MRGKGGSSTGQREKSNYDVGLTKPRPPCWGAQEPPSALPFGLKWPGLTPLTVCCSGRMWTLVRWVLQLRQTLKELTARGIWQHSQDLGGAPLSAMESIQSLRAVWAGPTVPPSVAPRKFLQQVGSFLASEPTGMTRLINKPLALYQSISSNSRKCLQDGSRTPEIHLEAFQHLLCHG